MNPKKRILEFLNHTQCTHNPMDFCEDCDRLQQIRDGMSDGTATIVINRAVGDEHADRFAIKDLKNKGRYYTAAIVNCDGKVIQSLIVDKQSGEVRFI